MDMTRHRDAMARRRANYFMGLVETITPTLGHVRDALQEGPQMSTRLVRVVRSKTEHVYQSSDIDICRAINDAASSGLYRSTRVEDAVHSVYGDRTIEHRGENVLNRRILHLDQEDLEAFVKANTTVNGTNVQLGNKFYESKAT